MKKSTSIPNVVRWKNKEFHSLDELDYNDLLSVLEDWETGACPSWEVSAFTEELMVLAGGWPDPPVNDPRFMLIEVSHLLEDIEGSYVFKEDIPALKRALQLGQTKPQEALDELNSYFDEVDFEAREKFISERFDQGLLWPP